MPRTTSNDFLLPTNAKAIRAAISRSHNDAVSEYRIKGVRGLVLHVLPSGTATWYAHYDIVRGKSRLRRKLKLGRHDELSLAQAIRAAEETRSLVQQGTDPAGQKTETRRGLTFADLVDHRFAKGDPLRPATKQDYDDILKTDILPFIGAVPANTVTR
ncbi:MAG: hypothetical protein RLZ98_1880, partial [Pseudomonadota bacterium]